jgi:hypothetical protein
VVLGHLRDNPCVVFETDLRILNKSSYRNAAFCLLATTARRKMKQHADGVAHGMTVMHYNFCRIHKTLRIMPALEVGISDYL